MTDAVVVALITSFGGIVSGAVGKTVFDRSRGKPSSNGNGGSVEAAIARRAEIEFQARTTVLLDRLTAAIEKGHERALSQMQQVSDSIAEAAVAIREVHKEIVGHREAAEPVIQTTAETLRLVRDLHNRPPFDRRSAAGGE